MRAAEEFWKHGLRFIGVIKTEMRKFMMTYLSNIELQNQGDISGLLTRPIDRTKLVLGGFFYVSEQAALHFYWGVNR